MHAFDGRRFDHNAARRRLKSDCGLYPAIVFEATHELGGDIPAQQLLTRHVNHALAELTRVRRLRIRQLIAVSESEQELVLHIQELRTENGEEYLSARDSLPHRVHEEIDNPAVEFQVHVGESRLVVPDRADSADRRSQGSPDHTLRADPDKLLAPRVDRDISAVAGVRRRRGSRFGDLNVLREIADD